MAVLRRRERFRRLGAAALAAAALVSSDVAASATPEYVIKAAYLYKFTPFVQWPASAFAGPSSPFFICVLGSDPFGASLDQALNGRQVGDHPVRVRRLKAPDASDGCHILYLSASRAQTATALGKARGAPVLTVTERALGVTGSVVQFVVRDGHVRFTIDADAAAANQMVISAKLLSLAAAAEES